MFWEYMVVGLTTSENYSFPELVGGALCVRLFLLSFSITLAKLAVFFFADDLGVAFCARTRIVGVATSSMKSNSRFLLDLKFKETVMVIEDGQNSPPFRQNWCTYALDVEFSMISLSDVLSGVGNLRPEHFQFNSNNSPASNLWYILSNSSADGSSSSFGPKHGMLQSSAFCCIESISRSTNLFIYFFEIFSIFDLCGGCLLCVLLLWRRRSVKTDSSRSLIADAIYRSSNKFHIHVAAIVHCNILKYKNKNKVSLEMFIRVS